MKTFKKWIRRSVLASCLTLTAFAFAASAAESQTVAVVSIADLNSVIQSLKNATTQAGYPDAMAQVEIYLAMLQGLETQQPIGIVVQADETSVGGYAFLPIANVSATPLADLVEKGEKQKDGSILLPLDELEELDGIASFVPQLYIKQASKWLFVSVNELPAKLPTNPSKLLEGLNKQYIISVKVNVNNLPKELTATGLALLRNLAEDQAETESDIEALDSRFAQIETILEELKSFVFGIAVSPENDIVIETVTEAAPDTTLSEDIAASANAKTHWSGFYQPQNTIFAAIHSGVLNAHTKTSLQTQIKSFFEGVREKIEEGDYEIDFEIDAALAALDNLQAVIDRTVKYGKLDFAATWKADGTFLTGLSISNGKQLQTALKNIVDAIPEEFQQYIKLNDSKRGDYSVSTVVVPISAWLDDEDLPKLAEKTLRLSIAIKTNALALALGLTDTVSDDLKKAIDASQTAAPLLATRFVTTLGNVENVFHLFFGEENSDNEQDQQMKEFWVSIPKDAQITFTVNSEGNAERNKIVVNNKLLPGFGKLVGAISTLFGVGNPMQSDDEFDIEVEELEEENAPE
ncbi:MAG: hypothetical protein LBT05_15140 [Planctomycetaceae bacterium]|jgi:ribosomal protein S20|nr:hypothetical protein [Planctomycetaceae bacterium]